MPTDAEFLPGLALSRILYRQAVRPILADAYPRLAYAAARIGSGSEVLGYDSARSTDHDWGPRLNLLLTAGDAHRCGDIDDLLAARLPARVAGWPTGFRRNADPDDPVAHLSEATGPVHHLVEIDTAGGWLTARLGFDPTAGEPSVADWLATPAQRLLEVTAGAVFHDGVGELSAVRRALAFYPDQVWRYVLASQWQRLAQEEAFAGRAAEAGDDLGSAVITARLVRELMRLCLLLHRDYPPYGKWLGSAFARLPVAADLTPHVRAALAATGYPDRQAHLVAAYTITAESHNATGLTAPLDPTCRPFHTRPYLVLDAGRFARALAATLTDPALAGRPLYGAVDQWADSTDLLVTPAAARAASAALG